MIDGVIRKPLRIIPDDRGAIMHMLRRDWPEFTDFGEVYYSCVAPGAVKAWRRHTRMTMQLTVPHGAVELVLYDARPGSPTEGEVQIETLSPDDPDTYALMIVPPGVWNGFRGIADDTSVVTNCASIPHDPDESDSLPADDPSIPHRWPAG
ncbi:MAG: dTDP-4-dehydrorhamnose 3,5-epimerase family protein [Rhodospirillales bacterium]|nr:dTDP-4-dehydrorhamnose 3,5-epimerase family protein [Rhodospirillales bacterium]